MFDVDDGFGGIEKETISFNKHLVAKEILSEIELENERKQAHYPILNYNLNLINSVNDTVFKLKQPWLKENLLYH